MNRMSHSIWFLNASEPLNTSFAWQEQLKRSSDPGALNQDAGAVVLEA